ncbi:MAG: hypothetical protein ACI4FX_10870 [Agathobacter sp.]
MQKVFEEIIDQIDDLYTYYDNDCCTSNGETLLAKREVIEIVKQAGDRYNGGWILCNSGKLPEEFVDVDVTIEETLESGEKEYYTARSWIQDGVWVVKKNPRHPKVIAWKYPAEPYIPKKNS